MEKKILDNKVEVYTFKDEVRTVAYDQGEIFVMLESFRTEEEAKASMKEDVAILEEDERQYFDWVEGQPTVLSVNDASSRLHVNMVLETFKGAK